MPFIRTSVHKDTPAAQRQAIVNGIHQALIDGIGMPADELLRYVHEGTDDRLFAVAELIRQGVDLGIINGATRIDLFFLEKFSNIVAFEKVLRAGIQTLISLSSPTGLALQWARRHNLNLIHLPQKSAPRVYSPAQEKQP